VQALSERFQPLRLGEIHPPDGEDVVEGDIQGYGSGIAQVAQEASQGFIAAVRCEDLESPPANRNVQRRGHPDTPARLQAPLTVRPTWVRPRSASEPRPLAIRTLERSALGYEPAATAVDRLTPIRGRVRPRAVNNLAVQSLFAAFAEGKAIVDKSSTRVRRHRGDCRVVTITLAPA